MQAFQLVQALNDPNDGSYARVLPSHERLILMEDDSECLRVLDFEGMVN
jgi:hypothetical protein